MVTLYVAAGALAQASSKPAVISVRVQGGLFKVFAAAEPTPGMSLMSAPQYSVPKTVAQTSSVSVMVRVAMLPVLGGRRPGEQWSKGLESKHGTCQINQAVERREGV